MSGSAVLRLDDSANAHLTDPWPGAVDPAVGWVLMRMLSEPSSWPAPLGALTWWPLTAFVLVTIDPSAAPLMIAVAGLVLAGIGAIVAAIRNRPSEVVPVAQPQESVVPSGSR